MPGIFQDPQEMLARILAAKGVQQPPSLPGAPPNPSQPLIPEVTIHPVAPGAAIPSPVDVADASILSRILQPSTAVPVPQPKPSQGEVPLPREKPQQGAAASTGNSLAESLTGVKTPRTPNARAPSAGSPPGIPAAGRGGSDLLKLLLAAQQAAGPSPIQLTRLLG